VRPESKLGLGKPGLKMGGPPSKPKYSLMTDSALVRRLNDENYRVERGERVAEIVCLQAVGANQMVTACFLHNEPASYSVRRA
jgi:hypothetical protein